MRRRCAVLEIYLFSVWCHVLAATAWIGSMLFFAFVVVPATRTPALAPNARVLILILGRRYRIFGWCALGVLLVTGVTNLLLRGFDVATLSSAAFWVSDFGRTLAKKLMFVALVIGATATHDLLMGARAMKRATEDAGSDAARAFRRRASWLGRSTLLLSLVVLFFAVRLVRGAP